MATCDPQELITVSSCLACLSEQQLKLIVPSLLCQILKASNPLATCDTQTLLTDAACFACYSDKQLAMVTTQLLCEILHSGGVSETCIICVDGDNEPSDSSPCNCAIAYNENGRFWFWNAFTNQWIPFIV